MKKAYLILAVAFLAVLSCGKNPDDGPSPTPKPIGPVQGVAPESGAMLVATLDEGLAPLSFTKTISNHCVGYAYSASGEMPDLFFQCPNGVPSANGIASLLGCSVCEFSGWTAAGEPVYSAPVPVSPVPWDNATSCLRMVQVGDKVYAFTVASSKLRYAVYDASARSFGSSWAGSVTLSGISGDPVGLDVIPGSGSSAELVLLFTDVDGTYRPDMDDVSESYYDSAGIYRGQMYYGRIFRCTIDLSTWKQAGSASLITGDTKVVLAPTGIAAFKFSGSGADGYLCSGKLGIIKYVSRKTPLESDYAIKADGNELLNPFVTGEILTIRAKNGTDTPWAVVSGEGAPRLYRAEQGIAPNGFPVISGPYDILMEKGDLYAGSLPVPTVADWDADGVLDIVTGNSEGRLLFFKNYGSNAAPAFGRAEELCSDGVPICFRAGYYEVQGPFEAAWGYLCPVVFDWDGDGLQDIVFSGNEGKFEFMRNEGTAKKPSLGSRQGIFLDGLELYGMWRVRPAVAKIGSRTVIAMMDGEDALHLYEKVTPTAVKDLGRAVLNDGKYIYGHRAMASSTLGERGREKLEFTDWDGDGDLDLLVGTPLQASVPNPDYGLPWSRTTRGLQTMWLENTGSDENMVFAYPKQFLFRGVDFHIGTHANGPTACMLGNISDGKPNLLVSGEGGKFFFFDRSELTELTLW